jgi:hypothetical protein
MMILRKIGDPVRVCLYDKNIFTIERFGNINLAEEQLVEL